MGDLMEVLASFGFEGCSLPSGSETQTAAVSAVNAFYAAVDTKDISALEAAVSTSIYEANFGDGCAVVGGSTHCGAEVLNYSGFLSMLDAGGARPGGTITRNLVASLAGDVVTNHYILPDGSHGTAVHYVRAGGRITSSFWYGGAVSSNELGTRCGTSTEGCSIQIVRDFYAAIDQNPPTANGVNDLDKLVAPLYRATFGAGCATVGGASRCGEKALSLVELKTMVGNNPRSSTVDRVLLAEGPMADTVVNHCPS